MRIPLLLLLLAFNLTGEIIDHVQCSRDASQSYALYLPSNYTAKRTWPVILAFDPRARGRTPVERYQPTAETHGYIVAGSNNSQNGSWAVSMAAAQAMAADVDERFAVDVKRIYTAGMSGGARVAMGIALGSNLIAGVIASSAGYPDSKPRKTVPFVVFGTAGTEDFNYLEMRVLDRTLTSPHRLAIFEGGHVWLSSDLAAEAVEWLEIQAMKSGRKPRDEAQLERILAKRIAAPHSSDKDTFLALENIVADFTGLKDVSALAAKAAELGRDKRVRDALKKDRAEESQEQRQLDDVLSLENQLASPDQRQSALAQLRDRWKKLNAASKASNDSPDRRIARRILRALSSGQRVQDPEYRKIVEEYRLPRLG